MGDETGLRPKAGKQREEPPDAEPGSSEAEVGRRDERRLWVDFEGPTIHTWTTQSPGGCVPLAAVTRFGSPGQQ